MVNRRTLPSAWVSGTNYAEDARVTYRGIVYSAINALTSSTTNPLEDETNWKVEAVHRIQDIYSLAEAAKVAINTTAPEVNDSMFMFVQLMEQSIATRLRVPRQITRTEIAVVNTDNNESYIDLPDSTLQIQNIRILTDQGGDDGDFNSLLYNGRYEVNEANYYEYQLIRQRYDSDVDFFDAVNSTQFRSMVYWNDGQRAYFAPNLDVGARVEVVYYGELTPLGYPILLQNADGQPVDNNDNPIPIEETYTFTEDPDGGTLGEGHATLNGSILSINGTTAQTNSLSALRSGETVRLQYGSTNTVFTLSANASIVGDAVTLTFTAAPPTIGNGESVMVTPITSRTQAEGIQESNWFLQAGPRMCLYGTIMQAEQYLKDDARWPLFQQQFLAAEAEIQELIDKFESKRSTAQYFRSDYPI